tara:strand:- start:940 stop:1152 length:213 start_codon:yes stop_codon:yes gene_type:complete
MINILLFVTFLYFLRQYLLQNQYIILLCDERVHLKVDDENNQNQLKEGEKILVWEMDEKLHKFCTNFIKN